MKILIGLPVYKRAWILPKWLEYIERQTVPLEDLGFIFELGPDDEETHNVLWEWQAAHPSVSAFDGLIREDINHETHMENGRHWKGYQYWRMVDLRNSLLDRAIALQPERFFSLDSDILLENPSTLEELYNRTATNDAVSPLTYMDPRSIKHPSVMSWIGGWRAKRLLDNYPIGTMFKADIIMAAVMMSKPVYETVRYRWHKQGEDLGWSADARVNKFDLWCASDIYGAHIMHEKDLDPYLRNGDSRSTNKN